MRLILLSDTFYKKYSNCSELLKKQNRPYYCMALQIDGVTYAIPFRHHINHPYGFKTVGEAGLDFSKAVAISSPDHISRDSPRIDTSEWNIIKRNEQMIFHNFRKYLNNYKRAMRKPDNPRNLLILKYSTLKFFITVT